VVEWLRYLGAMSLGGAVNYGSYAACIAASASCARVPALGVAIGSIAGLALNFLVSKHFVFRR
jgi:putative flippase GtrA